MPFGTVKLEWCGYPRVKNFEDRFIRFDRMTETQTQGHRMPAKIARQKPMTKLLRSCCVSQWTFNVIYRLRSLLDRSTRMSTTTLSAVSSTLTVYKWTLTWLWRLMVNNCLEVSSSLSLRHLHSTSSSHHKTSLDTLAKRYDIIEFSFSKVEL